jgi:hypothetical protein
MKKILYIILLLAGFTAAQAQVPLAGYVTTFGGSYPTHLDSLGMGGYMTTFNQTSRNAIPAARRKTGMMVRYSSADSTFVLSGGIANSNWVVFATSPDLSAYQPISQKQTNLTPSASNYPTVNAVVDGLAVKADISSLSSYAKLLGGNVFPGGNQIYDRSNVTINAFTSQGGTVTGGNLSVAKKITSEQLETGKLVASEIESLTTITATQGFSFSSLSDNGDIRGTGDITMSGSLKGSSIEITNLPTTSTTNYDILTRDIATGQVMKVAPSVLSPDLSNYVQKIGDGSVYQEIEGSLNLVDDLTAQNILARTSMEAGGDVVAYTSTPSKTLNLGEEVLESASTGIVNWAGYSILGNVLTINAGKGHVVNWHTNPASPTYKTVNFALQTLTPTGANIAYLYIDAAGIVQQTINKLTLSERKERLYLGKALISAGSLVRFEPEPDIVLNVANQLHEVLDVIGAVNNGVSYSSNAANLKLNISDGNFLIRGSGYLSDRSTPNSKRFGGGNAFPFRYITQTAGSLGSVVTDLNPGFYDVAGTVTAIPGAITRAANHYLYATVEGELRIQYGQTWYNSLSEAKQAAGRESLISNPVLGLVGSSIEVQAIPIGIISLTKNASNLQDVAQARFTFASKFGEYTTVGAQATTSLQQSYDNSVNGVIKLDGAKDFTIQKSDGTAAFGVNNAGNVGVSGSVTAPSFIGNATNSTAWNTQLYDPSVSQTSLDVMMGYNGVANKWSYYTSTNVANWLNTVPNSNALNGFSANFNTVEDNMDFAITRNGGSGGNLKLTSAAGFKNWLGLSGSYLDKNTETTQSVNSQVEFGSNISIEGTITSLGDIAAIDGGEVSGAYISATNLVSSAGNVTAGTDLIGAGLQITGGSPANGKVLTSNASGVATWQTPATPFTESFGNWTPATNFGSVIIGNATYVRQGSMMHITFGITIPTNNQTGQCVIEGLPSVVWTGVDFPYYSVSFSVNNTGIALNGVVNNSNITGLAEIRLLNALTNVPVSFQQCSGKTLYGTATYKTNVPGIGLSHGGVIPGSGTTFLYSVSSLTNGLVLYQNSNLTVPASNITFINFGTTYTTNSAGVITNISSN